jgi:hypothetical protein
MYCAMAAVARYVVGLGGVFDKEETRQFRLGHPP